MDYEGIVIVITTKTKDGEQTKKISISESALYAIHCDDQPDAIATMISTIIKNIV